MPGKSGECPSYHWEHSTENAGYSSGPPLHYPGLSSTRQQRCLKSRTSDSKTERSQIFLLRFIKKGTLARPYAILAPTFSTDSLFPSSFLPVSDWKASFKPISAWYWRPCLLARPERWSSDLGMLLQLRGPRSALYLPERGRAERTHWVPLLRQHEVRGRQMVGKVDVLGGDAQPGGGERLLLLHQGGTL